ncbi:MAG TPA: hypothetical protein VF519_08540 [Mycobacteriales bacterium]
MRAAAQQALSRAEGSPALRSALLELDAAVIRSRWFDHPAADTFRRIAGHTPAVAALRLTDSEHAALVACDPDVVGPLLDDDTQPARPTAAAAVSSHEPIELPPGPAGPVIVLDHYDTEFGWAVAEYDGITVSIGRPSRAAAIWTVACETTRHEVVDVQAQDAARRLVAKAHPALSTLALARPDLRPAPGEVVLLRLPDVVVIAPADLAARVAAYVAPVPVESISAEELPTAPKPATHVR